MDEHRYRGAEGKIAHPRVSLAVEDGPEVKAITQIRPAYAGVQTWLPIINRYPGWVKVLLDARPSGATGWLDATRVSVAQCHHEVRVHVGRSTLRLLYDGRLIGTWPISVASQHPIPAGRTLVHTSVRCRPHTDPVLLRLGVHARPEDSALVTIHPWPTGRAEPASRGCIRVPAAAMAVLGEVPHGCLVRTHPR